MVEGEHYPLSRHEHLTIILSITIITIMNDSDLASGGVQSAAQTGGGAEELTVR